MLDDGGTRSATGNTVTTVTSRLRMLRFAHLQCNQNHFSLLFVYLLINYYSFRGATSVRWTRQLRGKRSLKFLRYCKSVAVVFDQQSAIQRPNN
jgi:hypothetical protein